MQARSQSSVVLLYIGVIATALAVIAFGLSAVVKASAALSQAGARDKTMVEAQIESSRAIRRALATPVSIPPLPPITARPARDIASIQANRRPALSPEAMNALAMDQIETSGSAAPSAPAPDRHTATW